MEKEPWRLEKEKMVEDFHIWNQDAQKGQVVFAGSSLMEMFPIHEWAKELGPHVPSIYNRGVGGYTTSDMLPILDVCIFELEPRKVFINIGTNDLNHPSEPIEALMERYEQILVTIKKHLPSVQIYMMAYYPVNYDAASEDLKPCLRILTNDKINEANKQVAMMAAKLGHKFINVNAPLTDSKGRLKAEYTLEGMHINQDGYRAIFHDVMKYVLE